MMTVGRPSSLVMREDSLSYEGRQIVFIDALGTIHLTGLAEGVQARSVINTFLHMVDLHVSDDNVVLALGDYSRRRYVYTSSWSAGRPRVTIQMSRITDIYKAILRWKNLYCCPPPPPPPPRRAKYLHVQRQRAKAASVMPPPVFKLDDDGYVASVAKKGGALATAPWSASWDFTKDCGCLS